MSNGSEHIPNRDYKAQIDEARRDIVQLAAERDALQAENEKLRPVFEFVQGLNGNPRER
jgi:cell division protein FtsB